MVDIQNYPHDIFTVADTTIKVRGKMQRCYVWDLSREYHASLPKVVILLVPHTLWRIHI